MKSSKSANFTNFSHFRDRDSENGRVSYHFKVSNENVDETEDFIIDNETGEVRAKTMFDRELQDRYELVLVARDHGTPVSFETLRFVTIGKRPNLGSGFHPSTLLQKLSKCEVKLVLKF